MVMRTIVAVAVVGSAFLGACTPYGNARTVHETKAGGEIALEGSREVAQKKAEEAMAARCASGYEIDEAGETVVGQSSDSDTHARRGGLFTPPGTSTQTTSRDLTEWRIKYHCKGAEPEQKAAPEGEAAPQARTQYTIIVRF